VILCCNPHAQYLSHKDEIDRAIASVLESGWYVFGQEVAAFEHEFAQFLGVRHAVGVGSGTDAIRLALLACDIGPGDEVITVSHTAVATVTAIKLAGASPVLVDIEGDYFTIDPNRLESAIRPQTKAIVLVHLYGQAADVTAVKEIADRHNLRIIEDCAQCHGATYQGKQRGYQEQSLGSFGDVGCFSFYPTKNLSAFGDGGAVVTNDPKLAKQIRKLREYGWSETRESTLVGMNSRLDEIQAAVLRVKLRYLDADNEARGRIAARYDAALAETPLRAPQVRPESTHIYHQYVVQTDRRDELLAHLKSHRVAALVHYPRPVHLQSAYQGRLRGCDDLPQTENVVRRILSLPIYPELTQEDQRHVVGTINNFAAARDDRRRAA